VFGSDRQGLFFGITDGTDTGIPAKNLDIRIKFCPERHTGNIMDPAADPSGGCYRHPAPSGSQMGMIICSVKEITHAIQFGYNTEKTAHILLL
jgi:hypothetical protein